MYFPSKITHKATTCLILHRHDILFLRSCTVSQYCIRLILDNKGRLLHLGVVLLTFQLHLNSKQFVIKHRCELSQLSPGSLTANDNFFLTICQVLHQDQKPNICIITVDYIWEKLIMSKIYIMILYRWMHKKIKLHMSIHL
jgi:hypothetical protein